MTRALTPPNMYISVCVIHGIATKCTGWHTRCCVVLVQEQNFISAVPLFDSIPLAAMAIWSMDQWELAPASTDSDTDSFELSDSPPGRLPDLPLSTIDSLPHELDSVESSDFEPPSPSPASLPKPRQGARVGARSKTISKSKTRVAMYSLRDVLPCHRQLFKKSWKVVFKACRGQIRVLVETSLRIAGWRKIRVWPHSKIMWVPSVSSSFR